MELLSNLIEDHYHIQPSNPQHARSSRFINAIALVEDSFYQTFIYDIQSAEREVIIERSFMTNAQHDCFIPQFKRLIKQVVKIIVNPRHPKDIDGYMREQTWEAIKTLNKMNVKVRL